MFPSSQTNSKAVTLHVDVVDSEDELADLFLTPARYEQALQEVANQGGGIGEQKQQCERVSKAC